MQCDLREDETVEHMMLVCNKYERERNEMMRVVSECIGIVQWMVCANAGDHGMRVLLGLSEWSSEGVVGATKVFLQKAWSKRRQV